MSLALTEAAIAPPHTFFEAEAEAEEADELREFDASAALLDSELATEEDAELSDSDATETDELATSERLEAELETADAAEPTLLDAFSTIPGSVPKTDAEALADRLLALSL